MTDHTTHFDDCGCKSKALESERDALRLRVAALEAALRNYTESWMLVVAPPHFHADAEAALSGEPTALRELLERAVEAGRTEAEYDLGCECDVHSKTNAEVVSRILGTDKGGGE